ncbi:MAG TPA: DivIVA domain-containing protein [Acidimicrobiales bacterium]|nr:DivIVA domain-containing protein [Acidimicrobiales bacterium]
MAEAPLSAEEIAHRGFPSSFRGFDPAEVRAYLVRVAAELKAAEARERELRQKLTDAERRAANPVIDQAMLTKALGEETARVLASAQEAARQLQARAEDGVARILREAHEQAQRIRAEAEVVLADRSEEADAAAGDIRAAAQADAAALLDQARRDADGVRSEVVEQSRQLVHEAQAARARVLGDLARRRRIAHTQVEQLRAGRERLLDAYRVVRRTLDEVADELERVESEARTAAGDAARRVEAALEAGEVPRDEGESDLPGSDVAVPERPDGGPTLPAEPAAPPATAATAAIGGAEERADDAVGPGPSEQVPGPAPARGAAHGAPPAVPPPSTRGGSSAGGQPVVARAERAEERKLSSLRILRRPKNDPAPRPEREVVQATPAAEGVRVIPATADPPRPAPRSEREPPSIVPGVSWAAAPPVEAPAPPASGAPPSPQAPERDTQPASDAPGAAESLERLAPPAPGPPPAGLTGGGDVARSHSPVGTPADKPSDPPAPAPPPAATEPVSPASPVEALFARIRADRSGGGPAPDEAPQTPAPPEVPGDSAGTGSDAVPDASAPTSDRSPVAPPAEEEVLLQRRDEAIEAVESALTRKLKRALQDEHNDVLDRLRSCKERPSVLAVLPSSADQAARYASAAGELLEEAARHGARFVEADGAPISPEVTDVVAELTEALVGPLRRSIERGVERSQEDDSVLVDVIGAAYRECKTQRLEHLAGDATIAAFSRGTVSANAGVELRWVVDDGDAACPDCDDNALAGPTPSGGQYPTGQPHPPAHAGCRCLLVLWRP